MTKLPDSGSSRASGTKIPVPPPTPQTDKTTEKTKDQTKEGCAVSFLNEERNEMDTLCERTPAERREEYTQPDNEKEDGGEG